MNKNDIEILVIMAELIMERPQNLIMYLPNIKIVYVCVKVRSTEDRQGLKIMIKTLSNYM